MKKIFTLLFCVVAMGFAANASDFPIVDRCINALLGIDQPATLMASNLDANNDGMLSIADAATLIDQALEANAINRAPAQKIDIDRLMKEALETKTGDPDIDDVQEAVDENSNDQK